MTTYDIHTVTAATGERGNNIGLVAAETADAALAHAAELMGYADAAEMAADYAKAGKPQLLRATVSDLPATYTA